MKTLLLTMLVAVTGVAQAQIQDPTRPPASMMGGAAGAGAAAAPPAEPQLQSILIAPRTGGRHVVVIDGHTLRLGDRYKGAVLASVTGSQVVLQSGAKRQVLKLTADPVQR